MMYNRWSIVTAPQQRVSKSVESVQVAVVPSLLKLATVTGVVVRYIHKKCLKYNLKDHSKEKCSGGNGIENKKVFSFRQVALLCPSVLVSRAEYSLNIYANILCFLNI